MRIREVCLVLILVGSSSLLAQSPIADFSFNANICLNQEVSFANQSTNSTSYLWDFCHADLSSAGVASSVVSVPLAVTPTAITTVYFQGTWYGFLSSRDNNKIFRLDFGSSLENTPTVSDLGNIGGVLSGPENIKFIYENGLWYGLLINYSNNTLVRLSFPGGLNAAPTGVSLGNLGSWLTLRGLDLMYDGSRWIAIVSSFSGAKLSLINFGNSITNNPTVSNVVDILSGSISNPIGVKIIQESGNWYGVVASYTSNKILRLSFGSDLFSVPTFDEIHTVTNPTEVTLLKEGNTYHAHVSSANGSIHQINFGTSMATSVASLQYVNLGNFGVLGNGFGFDIVRSQPVWYGFSVNYVNGVVSRIKFEGSCLGMNLSSSNLTNPKVEYSQSGSHYAELSAYSNSLDVNVKVEIVTVQNLPAPTISFTNDNSCLSSVVNFSANETSGQNIDSWSWDFGDGNTDNSNSATVSHLYGSVGTRQVTLSVLGQNTCNNQVTKSISIFNPPISDFSLPTGSICTNQLLSFNNTSTYDVGSSPTWKWFVNNQEVATTSDLNYSFATDQSQTIKLTASILGCESEAVKGLATLKTGPSVDFSYTNNCYGVPVKFTNATTGSGITTHQWDFGDGITESVQENPQHQYAIAATYSVKLTVNNDQGCVNERTINLEVNDQPLADFNNTDAIENLPITFTGEDLTLSDDQINQWNWDFNSMGQAQGGSVTFSFSSIGSVPISVAGTTDQGCTFYFTKSILISASSVPSISVSFNSTACLDENILIQNNSVNAADYVWDFCFDDLKTITGLDNFVTVGGAISPEGIRSVYDQGVWYTFVTSRDNGKLFRVNSSDNLSTNKIVSEVSVSGLSLPMDIRLEKLNAVWYAFILNSGTGKISRLRFGNGLGSNPDQTTDLGNFGVLETGVRGFDLVRDGSSWYASVVNFSNDKLCFLNLGNALDGATITPLASSVFSTTTVTKPISASLIKDQNGWHALIASYDGNSIIHINFNLNLFAIPSATEVTKIYTVPAPFEIAVVKEGFSYHGYVINTFGELHYLDFGTEILNALLFTENKTNFGNAIKDGTAVEIVRTSPNWKLLAVDYLTKKISILSCASVCEQVTRQSSSEIEPINVSYMEPGDHVVELTAQHQNGSIISSANVISVSSIQAPTISFDTETNCITSPAEIRAQASGSPLDNYLWDFGDNTTYSSSLPTATHLYTSVGEYGVNLQVHAQNGCNNFTVKNISIFNPPVSSFTLPDIGANPICSNQLYHFANTTSFDNGSEPTWEWSVNGDVVSDQEDLEYAYGTSNDQIVSLKSSIPGCSNSEEKTITNILEGPVSDFLIAGICSDSPTTFTNASVGQIDGFTWDLGDGSPPQTTIDVIHTYPQIGTYLVKLTANASNDCNNFTQKEIIIRSKPQPDFSLDLPPFSCAGSPSQFNDLTSLPTDSNVNSWNWNFGDAANGSATIKNPTYAYSLAGPYSVSLTATTNFGCSASVVKPVQIADPPKVGFTLSPSCLNQLTYFTDASTGANKSWLWKIGNSSYSLQNPAHVFSSTGNYTAQLTVTGSNDCVSVLSKPINVPVPPITDFTVKNNCAGLATVFEDVTASGADPVVTRAWNFGGQGTGDGTSTQFYFQTPGTYNVKLTVTNQSGCDYTLAKNTSIVVAPVAAFTTSVESGPPPLSVEFANMSSGATAFQWSFNDSANSTSTEDSPSFTFSDLGDYVVDLTAINQQGCMDTESKIVRVIIPYTEIELEDFELLHDAVTGSIRPVLTIKNNSNHTISSVEVLLDIAGNASVKEKIATSILPNGVSSQILNYELLPGAQLGYLCAEVRMTDDANLENNTECVSLQSDELIFPPYPNPVVDQLSIDWIAASEGSVKVSVLTQTGQVAFQKEVGGVGVGLNQIVLDISQLNSGFYILIFESAEAKKTFPLVIQN